MPTLLLVDDEPDIRELVSMALEMTTSWTIRCVPTAREALDAIGSAPPDGLLLDMMMPDLNGVELLTAIRALPAGKSIPAVFLSGRSRPAGELELAMLDVAGVIEKPFDPHALGTQLSRFFGWQA